MMQTILKSDWFRFFAFGAVILVVFLSTNNPWLKAAGWVYYCIGFLTLVFVIRKMWRAGWLSYHCEGMKDQDMLMVALFFIGLGWPIYWHKVFTVGNGRRFL